MTSTYIFEVFQADEFPSDKQHFVKATRNDGAIRFVHSIDCLLDTPTYFSLEEAKKLVKKADQHYNLANVVKVPLEKTKDSASKNNALYVVETQGIVAKIKENIKKACGADTYMSYVSEGATKLLEEQGYRVEKRDPHSGYMVYLV